MFTSPLGGARFDPVASLHAEGRQVGDIRSQLRQATDMSNLPCPCWAADTSEGFERSLQSFGGLSCRYQIIPAIDLLSMFRLGVSNLRDAAISLLRSSFTN